MSEREVHRRRDGILEIRRPGWLRRDHPLARAAGVVACALLAAAAASGLVAVAAGVLTLVAALWGVAALVRRLRARRRPRSEPEPAPVAQLPGRRR
ncbi:MAG TPA: hypothetical protein VFP50_18930 [Anaeromyxobacteraceae bacterium]|nr:hypothetical protein [Anaeromyxobacteraceae bacterium]